jgi:threonine dehydratase
MHEGYAELSLDNIRGCRSDLGDAIVRTPVVPCQGEHFRALQDEGMQVWFKLELFQRTGTFKARGALNSVRHLSAEARRTGITAVSAGNHAIAAAFAARASGTTAKVVMIKTANPARVARARGYGAEIVFADDGPSAFAMAAEIVQSEGRAMVHPFEGPHVAQGTGTLGLEFVEQVEALDAVVIAVGGGGLCGGAAAAIKQSVPQCEVFGVEPEGADSMRQSFERGAPVTLSSVKTIADSLAPPMSLPYSFGACRLFVDEIVTVSDDAICGAMNILFEDTGLAVEPAGATATAGLLGPLRGRLAGKKVGVVICGSNIDIASFAEHLRQAPR